MKIPQEVQCWDLYERNHKQDGGTDRDSRHYALGWAAAADWSTRQQGYTMSEHTPGPWIRTGRGFSPASGGGTVGACSLVGDAVLCAAAPDMLEALYLASVSCGFNRLNTAAQKRILAAIAKATACA